MIAECLGATDQGSGNAVFRIGGTELYDEAGVGRSNFKIGRGNEMIIGAA